MLAAIFRRQKVFLLTLLLSCILGGVLLTRLPVQLYPQTQRPRVFVRINHAGYSAVDFSRQYGDEVESGFLTIKGIDSLEVAYRSDSSDFRITFDWKVDSDLAKADVEAAMSSIRTSLPEDIRDNYSVRFFTGENAGFLLLGVRSESTSPKALYSLMKSVLENRLARVEDAETVEINNIEDRDVEVLLKEEALLAYGLTINDVDSAFRAGYLPLPLGSIEDGGQNFSVRYSRGIDTIYELEELTIAERGDVSVHLADVADITIS